MKRALVFLLTAALVISMFGCSGNSPSSASGDSQSSSTQSTPASEESKTTDFPTGTITIVVPYSAGGGNDVNARRLAAKSEEIFGVKMVVENVPGGNTLTGAAQVLGGKADGYTLIANSCTGLLASPQMYGNPYDLDDWTPIISQNTVPMVLVAGPSAPSKTTAEDFIQYCKDNPGTITVGCAGYGDSSGMGAAIVFAAMGIDVQLIPFNSASESLANVLGGHVDYANMPVSTSFGNVESGELVPLFEFGGLDDNAYDVPSVVELGYGDAATPYYRVICAPAGTPDDVVAILREGFTKMVNDPDLQKEFEEANDPLLSPITDPQELQDRMAKDWEAYGETIERLGLGE
jgi:tripartite-type tricarboxylate transporter receptor subunit TctC